MMNLLSPRLFVSYSRHDYVFVEQLVGSLKRQGFRVFLDSSDIDPGDNFVAKLSKEIKRTTAIVPVISEKYSLSRWAQAELYQALTTNKMAIPVLISTGSISSLDEPLQRLLRDRQYVTINEEMSDQEVIDRLAELLSIARRRYRYESGVLVTGASFSTLIKRPKHKSIDLTRSRDCGSRWVNDAGIAAIQLINKFLWQYQATGYDSLIKR